MSERVFRNSYRPQSKAGQRKEAIAAKDAENTQHEIQGQTPELLFAEKQRKELLYKAIDNLPPVWRELIRMQLQEASPEEMSTQTGIPVEKIESTLQQIQERLAQEIKGK